MPNSRTSIFTRQLTLVFALGLQSSWLMAQTPDGSQPALPTSTESTPNTVAGETPQKTTSSEKVNFVSTAERDNTLLAVALPDEVRWLETPQEKVIALFKAAETSKPQGSLLILHASELPQLWPASLESLRRTLPIYGWDTMAVPLPNIHAPKTLSSTPAATDNSSRDNSSTNSSSTNSSSTNSAQMATSLTSEVKTALPRAQIINERVTAAVTLLGKIGQPNIFVLTDNSSAPDSLVEIYKNKIQALILVNLQNQEPLTQTQLAAIFSQPKLPVLDVFFKPDDSDQITRRRLHQAEAMRKNLINYQQLILPPEHFAVVDDKQGFWLEKVRGFMKKKSGNVANKK